MKVYFQLVGFNLHLFLKTCLAVAGFLFLGGVRVFVHKYFPTGGEIVFKAYSHTW